MGTTLPTLEATSLPSAISPTGVAGSATATVPLAEAEIQSGAAQGVRPEFVIGGIALAGVLLYVGLYWRGQTTADRYARGFIVRRCPVCGEGHLRVEVRQERTLGIPRPRAIVRCNHCRSILRQTGQGKWRYAIDPIANPALYARYNGQVLDELQISALVEPLDEDR